MTTDDRAAPHRRVPYLQVADRLEDRIRRGEFGGDGKLPATGDLAEWCGVGKGVVRHAREELVRRNLAVLRFGQGYFARAPETPANTRNFGTAEGSGTAVPLAPRASGPGPPQGSRRPGHPKPCPAGGTEMPEGRRPRMIASCPGAT